MPKLYQLMAREAELWAIARRERGSPTELPTSQKLARMEAHLPSGRAFVTPMRISPLSGITRLVFYGDYSEFYRGEPFRTIPYRVFVRANLAYDYSVHVSGGDASFRELAEIGVRASLEMTFRENSFDWKD